MAETFYKLDLQIEVLEQEVKFDTIHVSFQVFKKKRDTNEIKC